MIGQVRGNENEKDRREKYSYRPSQVIGNGQSFTEVRSLGGAARVTTPLGKWGGRTEEQGAVYTSLHLILKPWGYYRHYFSDFLGSDFHLCSLCLNHVSCLAVFGTCRLTLHQTAPRSRTTPIHIFAYMSPSQ